MPAQVDSMDIGFKASGTSAYSGAKTTALITLNDDQLNANQLGCTLGMYWGWFQKNVAQKNVCLGAEFTYTVSGNLLTLHGTMKAVPTESAATVLAGKAPMDPPMTFFQGDGIYNFTAAPNGAQVRTRTS